MGSVAKSYMKKDFLIYEEMRKYLTIYEGAVSYILLCNRSLLNFLLYEENLIFFFISAQVMNNFCTHCLSYMYLMQNLSNSFYELDAAEIASKRIMIRHILDVACAPSYTSEILKNMR